MERALSSLRSSFGGAGTAGSFRSSSASYVSSLSMWPSLFKSSLGRYGSRGGALVSCVEEWIELSFLNNSSDLFPLIKSWVNTSWIVSTCVKKSSYSWSSGSQILNHTIEIESLSLLMEISILSNIKTTSGKNGIMIYPSRICPAWTSWIVLVSTGPLGVEWTSALFL